MVDIFGDLPPIELRHAYLRKELPEDLHDLVDLMTLAGGDEQETTKLVSVKIPRKILQQLNQPRRKDLNWWIDYANKLAKLGKSREDALGDSGR